MVNKRINCIRGVTLITMRSQWASVPSAKRDRQQSFLKMITTCSNSVLSASMVYTYHPSPNSLFFSILYPG
jgi:hypothetical protein